MPRLIDADAIPYKKIMFDDDEDDFYYGVTQPYIDRMPTIDAVPVVRCRECWAYGTDNEQAKAEELNPAEYCVLMRCEYPSDGYCSYGRRIEDGDVDVD